MTKENILSYLREIKDELAQDGIQSIALFGSYATGNASVYSDIDIAIRKDHDFLKHYSAYDYFATLNKLKQKISSNLKRPVDIFDLDSRSNFKQTIEKELIYV